MKRSAIVILSNHFKCACGSNSAQKKSELCVAQQAAKKKDVKMSDPEGAKQKRDCGVPQIQDAAPLTNYLTSKNTPRRDPDSFRDIHSRR